MLRGALLSVKFSVLPVEPRHRDEVDLVYSEATAAEESVHFESLNQRSIHSEDVNHGLLLVGGEDVASIVQDSPDLQVRGTAGSYGAATFHVRVIRLGQQLVVGNGNGCDRVLDLVLQFDSGRFDMVREDVVEALPLLSEVVSLEDAQTTDLVESNQTSLVEGDQELAS